MGKLLAIPWWSIPLFIVGMYDIYIGSNQGFVILGLTALVSLLLKVFDKKVKTLLTLPWWSVPFFIISTYGVFKNHTMDNMSGWIRTDPDTVLLVVTGCCTMLFCYLVFRYNKQTRTICPKCNRETWKHKDGTLPFSHRNGICTKTGFKEPRKPRGV